MNLDVVLSSMRKVRQVGNGKWQACCPAHDDRDPSLSLSLGRQPGTIVLHCHAGCSVDEIRIAAGLSWDDLMPEQAIAHHIPPETRRRHHVVERPQLDRVVNAYLQSGRIIDRPTWVVWAESVVRIIRSDLRQGKPADVELGRRVARDLRGVVA